MSTYNICFRGEIRKILTRYPLLSRPMENSTGELRNLTGYSYLIKKYIIASMPSFSSEQRTCSGGFCDNSGVIFLISYKNIHCGYSLEASQ